MKKTLAALVLVVPMTLGLTGCIIVADGDGSYDHISSDFRDQEYENRKKIAQLALDTSYFDVQNSLGVPDFNETYNKDGEVINVLFYRTNRKHKDSMTTKDECTPLVFKNQKLVSWGEKAYQQM